MIPLVTFTLILLQFLVPCASQVITYLTCTTNSDCAHFKFSVCQAGKCQACSSNDDCLHLDLTSNCLTDDISTYCQVPCDDTKGADICAATNSLCSNDGTISSCRSCANSTDCGTQYPAGVQCLTVSGTGHCGYCLIDSQCPTAHTCKNFKCVQCSSNLDCSFERPVCDITLKASTCKCRNDADCPASKPTCYQKYPSDIPACFLRPSLTLTKGEVPEKVILKFNKVMNPTSDIEDILTFELVGVDPNFYSYELIKIDSQTYHIYFSCNMDIITPQLQVEITRPSQLPDFEGLILLQTAYTLQMDTIDLLPRSHQAYIPRFESLSKYGSIVLLSVSVVVSLLNFDTIYFWMLLNFLQNSYYLLEIKAEYPASAIGPLRSFSISTFDFIPDVITTLLEDSIQELTPSLRQLVEGKTSHILLLNISRVLALLIGILVIALIVILLTKVLRLDQAQPYLLKLKKLIVWSGVFRVIFACYQELCFASILQLTVISFKSTLFGVSSLLGILGTVFVVILPILFMPSLRRKAKTSADYEKELGPIVYEYNLNIFIGRFYLSLNLYRRLAVTLVLIFLRDYPIISVMIFLAFNIAMMIFLACRPYKAAKHNFINRILEGISIFFNFLILSLLLDEHGGEPDGEIRIWTAWEMVATVLVVIFAGISFSIYEGIEALIKWKKWHSQPPAKPTRVRGESIRKIRPYNGNSESLDRSDMPLDHLGSLSLWKSPSFDENPSITFRKSLYNNNSTRRDLVNIQGDSNPPSNYSSGSTLHSLQQSRHYLQLPNSIYMQPNEGARKIRRKNTQEAPEWDIDLSIGPNSSPSASGMNE